MPRYTKYDKQMMQNIKGYGMSMKGSVYDWLLRLDLDNITEKQKGVALQLANMNSDIKARRAIYNDTLYRVAYYPKYWQLKDGKWQFIKRKEDFPDLISTRR